MAISTQSPRNPRGDKKLFAYTTGTLATTGTLISQAEVLAYGSGSRVVLTGLQLTHSGAISQISFISHPNGTRLSAPIFLKGTPATSAARDNDVIVMQNDEGLFAGPHGEGVSISGTFGGEGTWGANAQLALIRPPV